MSLPKIYAGHRRRWLWMLIANGIGQAVCGVVLAYLLRDALSSARSGESPWQAALGISAIGGLMLALRVREARDAERMGQHFVMRVRLRIFDRLTKRSSRDVSTGRLGVTMTRLISDLNSLRNWVSTGVARAIVASISAVGLLIGFVWLNPGASAGAMSMVMLCIVAGVAITPTLRLYIRESRRRRGRLANNLGEKILAIPTVKELGRVRVERNRVRRHSRTLADALVRRAGLAAMLRSLPDLTMPLAVAGIAMAATSRPDVARDSVVAVLLLGLIASSLRDLARSWDHRLAFEEGRRRIDQLLAGSRIVDARDSIDLPGEGPVRLEYSGVGIDGLFEDVDLRVEPGERVVVTGPSGSGKSSLLALATRSFEPDSGAICLDGRPLREFKLDSLHEAVQRVSRDLPLLRGTIGENIGYGLSGIDSDRVDRVIAACGLDERAADMPDGLETRVEEQGANLSEGLRARVALARACAVSPRLLLVDAPAFHTDSNSARALARVLELMPVTCVVVGPGRWSSIGGECRVMTLAHGHLAEAEEPFAEAARSDAHGALSAVSGRQSG